MFRKQQKAMEKCPLNLLPLCYEHHRGNKSPHRNRGIDIKYKKQLQTKLEWIFKDDLYDEEEVAQILMIKIKEVMRLLKPISVQVIDGKVGYLREDIIRQAMGGRLY